MPTFAYSGRTRGGQNVSGERVADTTDAAVAALRRERVFVTKIDAVKGRTPAAKKARRGKKVPAKNLAIFTRQFSVMIDAGLPLVQCLEILGNQEEGVYPGFPIRLGALPGFVVGDLMWKALWKFVENEQRFPRRGGRVLCVHGAVSFHRARPCARPVCRPGRHEGSLEAYRQNCDESGLQMSPPGPLRRHDLPDRGQPRYPCADSEPFAYPVR